MRRSAAISVRMGTTLDDGASRRKNQLPTNASGARIVRVAPGSPAVTGSFLQRDYTQNSMDGFIHDNWQVTPQLNLNFGVRYSYLGPLGDKMHRITTFIPGKGKPAFDQKGVEFPKFWSQTATNIVGQKYFRGRLGSPERESSVRQMIGRVVTTVVAELCVNVTVPMAFDRPEASC